MKAITISYAPGRSHPLLFDSLVRLPVHLAAVGLLPRRCLVVTDQNVAPLLLRDLVASMNDHGWQIVDYIIDPGESSKCIEVLRDLYDFALASDIDRSTPVVALGGGVVGDLAGFCAATVLRGIPLVHVPTTLVSQVDSSIGGKTGINHEMGKNLIGSFYQPRLVLTDTEALQTLPEREWRSGLAEVVKHALLDGSELTHQTLATWEGLSSMDPAILAEVVPQSAAVKVGIVTADEREVGRRTVLNLGHTIGHAIERTAGYGDLSHGEAVAAGLALALRISDAKFPRDDRAAAWDLLRRLGWPDVGRLDFAEIMSATRFDKKRDADTVRFVLLRSPGRPEILSDVTVDDIREAWNWLTTGWQPR